jgi:hypothetical protein
VESPPPAHPDGVNVKPQTTVDDLTRLLGEFEEATKPKADQQSESGQQLEQFMAAKEPQAADALATVQQAYENAVKDGASGVEMLSLRKQLETVTGMVQSMAAHQAWEHDHREFDGIVQNAEKMLKDSNIPVSDDYVRRWLLSEAKLNPQLATAFDNRNRSPEARRQYKREETKAMERLAATARRQPDQDATADRAAVVWAMRNPKASMPPSPPVRYGDLTDSEFTAEKKKYGL